MSTTEANFRTLTTKEKALRINLDAGIYGSFAEIGAGQEIAANFFKAGGASGTVAKTMSAYDMSFSDAIYGKCSRYVCEERLDTMLEREFKLLNLRLNKRKATTKFFAMADTVETLNYQRTNRGHGWLGLRFQLEPDSEPNDCIVHVVMHDVDSVEQQQAMGVVGVNLLYGCHYHHNDPEQLINSLVDNLIPGRIEVDMFRISGPDFKGVDNRLLALKLVKNGLTNATMFGPKGNVLQASEVLYKKDVLVLRGRFRPVTKVNMDMLTKGLAQFVKEPEVNKADVMVISELTLNALHAEGKIDEKDFLDRVDILCSLGQTVMISTFREYYKLVHYFARVTKTKHVGIILGALTMHKLFDSKYYGELKGNILESFGILFGNNVKMYVYPAHEPDTDELMTSKNFPVPDDLKYLYKHLQENNKIGDIEDVDLSVLHIISDKALAMIKAAEDGWEDMVPENVEDIIKDKCLFDYPCSLEQRQKLDEKERKRKLSLEQ